jgi:hypothetical protein
VGIFLRSLGLVVLFSITFHQLNKGSFVDVWSSGVEDALLKENFSRLYMDGPRPFFVQRSHPTAKIFYDLNARFRSKDDKSQICLIKACFNPELWVISNYQKSPETLDLLANEFGNILHREPSFFVAKNPQTACESGIPRCESLLMKK